MTDCFLFLVLVNDGSFGSKKCNKKALRAHHQPKGKGENKTQEPRQQGKEEEHFRGRQQLIFCKLKLQSCLTRKHQPPWIDEWKEMLNRNQIKSRLNNMLDMLYQLYTVNNAQLIRTSSKFFANNMFDVLDDEGPTSANLRNDHEFIIK